MKILYYNKRNSSGRFTSTRRTKTIKRAKARLDSGIRNGSLYDLNGLTVRALSVLNNGLRLVGYHRSLFGFAHDADLKKVDKTRVDEYLSSNV